MRASIVAIDDGVFIDAGFVEGIDKEQMVAAHRQIVEFDDLGRERDARQEHSRGAVDLKSDKIPDLDILWEVGAR